MLQNIWQTLCDRWIILYYSPHSAAISLFIYLKVEFIHILVLGRCEFSARNCYTEIQISNIINLLVIRTKTKTVWIFIQTCLSGNACGAFISYIHISIYIHMIYMSYIDIIYSYKNHIFSSLVTHRKSCLSLVTLNIFTGHPSWNWYNKLGKYE